VYRVAVVVGTRPEVIKMAPVVRELREHPGQFATTIVSTAQHRELLRQALDAFALEPDVDLGLMRPDQAPGDFAGRCLIAMSALLEDLRPDALLVQGDTTTVVAAATAAAYRQILVGHVEAGLRSFDRDEPFPEELNRRMTGVLAGLHFAPTERARHNLLREGVAEGDVTVTGNTIVDALRSVSAEGPFESDALAGLPLDGRRLLLVTVHRREHLGLRLVGICSALRRVAERHPEAAVVLPVHPNPRVREVVEAELGAVGRIHLVPAVSYRDMLRLLRRAYLVLTDSGGIQEEAPSFRVPVLVLRDVTERPELIEAGGGLLVGTEPDRIVRTASRLLRDEAQHERMRHVVSPFGDGRAAERIVAALGARLAGRRDGAPVALADDAPPASAAGR
jgi:UDP-N-acetylglucosamine 2-epimerase (non-hydrolysing)